MSGIIRRWWKRHRLNQEARRCVVVISGSWPGDCVIRNTRTGENLYVTPLPAAPRTPSTKSTLHVTRGIGSVVATRMHPGDEIIMATRNLRYASTVSLLPESDRQSGSVLVAPTKKSA